MRTDDIHRQLGRKLVMRVVARLVFGKVFGLAQLADIVVVRGGAGERGVLVEGDGASLRQVRDDDGVVERAHRAVFHLAHEGRVVVGQLAQAIVGDAVKNSLEHGQQRHKEHRRQDARFQPEQQEIHHLDAAVELEAGDHQEDGRAHGKAREEGAQAGLHLVPDEDSNHARGKGHQRRAGQRVDVLVDFGKVGKIVDCEHHERENHVQKDGVAPPQQHEREQREHGNRAGIDVEKVAEKVAYEDAHVEHQKDEPDALLGG